MKPGVTTIRDLESARQWLHRASDMVSKKRDSKYPARVRSRNSYCLQWCRGRKAGGGGGGHGSGSYGDSRDVGDNVMAFMVATGKIMGVGVVAVTAVVVLVVTMVPVWYRWL